MKIRHGIDLESEAIRQFCRKWKIAELAVFGSVLRDDFGPDSDVDFLVSFENPDNWDISDLFDMQDELSHILARRVDFIERSAIEQSENWIIRQAVLGSAEKIIAA